MKPTKLIRRVALVAFILLGFAVQSQAQNSSISKPLPSITNVDSSDVVVACDGQCHETDNNSGPNFPNFLKKLRNCTVELICRLTVIY